VKWKLLILLAAGLACALSSAAQDLGNPDSVRIEPSTLYIGRSYPVRIAVVNDRLLKTINFGLITRTRDTGFARLDSIVYLGRMGSTTVLNLRLSTFREFNGVSPDTAVICAFWAGSAASKLGPGNTAVAAIYMTGTHLGSMTIDSGFLPPGGEFLVIPWDTNFTAVGFAPRFRSTTIAVRPAKYVCGNVDGDPDGGIDIADLGALIDYLYISLVKPLGWSSANIDDSPDHGVDISDLSALIDYLYLGGPRPTCQSI
jgi:hypothetical protein